MALEGSSLRVRPVFSTKGGTHMKNIIQGVVLTGALVLGGTALAQGKAMADKAGTADYQGYTVPSDPKSFLERLHYANQAEIKQAQLAQKTSTNEDVKAFAAQMEKQHTEADQKVMDLAKTLNVKLADLPKPMNDMEKKAMAADKATMEKLQVLKGMPFDNCYMATQLGEHDMVLGKLMAGKQAMASNADASALINELHPRRLRAPPACLRAARHAEPRGRQGRQRHHARHRHRPGHHHGRHHRRAGGQAHAHARPGGLRHHAAQEVALLPGPGRECLGPVRFGW